MTTQVLDRTIVFIDGSNLYATAKALDMTIDFSRMLSWIEGCTNLVRAYYYTAIVENKEGFASLQPLTDWLGYNGFTVVTKAAKHFSDDNGYIKTKGNMDIELAVDMLEMASIADHMILFSGDGDFRRLVEAVQRKGVKVTVISSMKTSPPIMSDELRRQTDIFIDLENLRSTIEKKGNGR